MPSASVTITAFEHQFLPYAAIKNWQESHAAALERLQAAHKGGSNWFTLERKGIRFCEYVGIIQLPGLAMEILPKADNPNQGNKAHVLLESELQNRWRNVLLGMLQQVLDLPLSVPSAANLATVPHRMLDVFLKAFIQQTEFVYQNGLVKHYHVAEGNRAALKGQLLFGQHLNHNLLHKERFYTRHQVYDRIHPLNALLRMALLRTADLARNAGLAARARTFLLHWPELAEVSVPEERPALTRKTQRYGPALDLALLILRAQSPSLQRGHNQALALLFDMNSLFEGYIESLLRRAATAAGCTVHAQQEKTFWATIKARPDIVVSVLPTDQDPTPVRNCILDVKWKVPKAGKPTADDMRQVYAYCHLWGATHGVLLYPWVSEEQQPRRGIYAPSEFAEAGTQITGQTLFAPVLQANLTLNPRLGLDVLSVMRTLQAPNK
ncbi:McrC family protein [Hymenobacter jeollabukensis]|uniref:Restriction endonuclease n=1 Tax=Hymenobacter jeollabukensis TaxID=2025313 RepID=A0A5R8WJB3_9BACT|nr:hypothetical protein [Hymenobacter jeollabukensis]TLM88985.1 hypothetical protein FDY95_22655 [Hymenobacter jeollabukensis]